MCSEAVFFRMCLCEWGGGVHVFPGVCVWWGGGGGAGGDVQMNF